MVRHAEFEAVFSRLASISARISSLDLCGVRGRPRFHMHPRFATDEECETYAVPHWIMELLADASADPPAPDNGHPSERAGPARGVDVPAPASGTTPKRPRDDDVQGADGTKRARRKPPTLRELSDARRALADLAQRMGTVIGSSTTVTRFSRGVKRGEGGGGPGCGGNSGDSGPGGSAGGGDGKGKAAAAETIAAVRSLLAEASAQLSKANATRAATSALKSDENAALREARERSAAENRAEADEHALQMDAVHSETRYLGEVLVDLRKELAMLEQDSARLRAAAAAAAAAAMSQPSQQSQLSLSKASSLSTSAPMEEAAKDGTKSELSFDVSRASEDDPSVRAGRARVEAMMQELEGVNAEIVTLEEEARRAEERAKGTPREAKRRGAVDAISRITPRRTPTKGGKSDGAGGRTPGGRGASRDGESGGSAGSRGRPGAGDGVVDGPVVDGGAGGAADGGADVPASSAQVARLAALEHECDAIISAIVALIGNRAETNHPLAVAIQILEADDEGETTMTKLKEEMVRELYPDEEDPAHPSSTVASEILQHVYALVANSLIEVDRTRLPEATVKLIL